jgi:uridylate kinase
MTMVTEQAVAIEDEAPASLRPRRVVLKLSGEVFGGGAVGVDPDVVQGLARQIATVIRRGIQVAVVVGGGNFFRGAELQKRGMDRNRADYMGMLGTVMNALALQASRRGCRPRSTWPRSPSRTSRFVRSATSRRGAP